ncbi:histidine phosphatase family protein [Calidifontimicrobium sp. SYSU G02091]|uniref:histidine phosphatase family protein n=1 Tax=Calidifontimicrobium sp. SYSU G02091 TaxID=2926421 RepID=UPI001F533B9A|nr:histidine phosphatase family protein [Calidifontimicrobium sp. SYSU G02091]MCI1190320.1 histidine phosphatase family protein [Calidifontimicrobium sp. SYSU G02091]
MRSSRWPDGLRRRPLLLAALAAPALARAAGDDVVDALRAGGVVAAFRHALAPGTFDPPGFRLGDCATQRNLSDDGRAQARRLGEWFRARGLEPAAVRSSPWCRCIDTAQLAFGRHVVWDALASPTGADATTRERRIAQLRDALAAVPAARFEVWVTHQFVLNDLTGNSTSSAEGLLLKAATDGGRPQVLARLNLA